jgi:hypothetical protein
LARQDEEEMHLGVGVKPLVWFWWIDKTLYGNLLL